MCQSCAAKGTGSGVPRLQPVNRPKVQGPLAEVSRHPCLPRCVRGRGLTRERLRQSPMARRPRQRRRQVLAPPQAAGLAAGRRDLQSHSAGAHRPVPSHFPALTVRERYFGPGTGPPARHSIEWTPLRANIATAKTAALGISATASRHPTSSPFTASLGFSNVFSLGFLQGRLGNLRSRVRCSGRRLKGTA